MDDDELFPSKLNEVMEDYTIPRILRKDEKLDLFRKYYFPEFDQKVKCVEIEIYDDFIFYFLSNDSFQYVLPFPIDYPCYTFTLDKYRIIDRDIINDHQVYRGYQIKWWFYKHRLPIYQNFFPLLKDLCDDNVYTVHGVLENGKYKDSHFVLKRTRSE